MKGTSNCAASALATWAGVTLPVATSTSPSRLPLPHERCRESAAFTSSLVVAPASTSSSPIFFRIAWLCGAGCTLAFDLREVFVAREDALLDQQLDHRLQR